MKPNEYVKKAIMTESNDFEKLGQRLSTPRNIRLLHATIGSMTEIGELFEMLEKEEIDLTNLREEVGDITWYIAVACDEMKWDLEEIIKTIKVPKVTKSKLRNKIIETLASMVKHGSRSLDLMKKSAFYGRDLNQESLKTETLGLLANSITLLKLGGFDLEESFDINIKKLQEKRFKQGKFTETEALNRNLAEERKTLEGKD